MKVFYEFEPSGNDLKDNMLVMLFEKNKYELMWTLRFLEHEINEAGGQLIITVTGDKSGVETRGFSSELTDKITKAIKESNFPSPFLPGMPGKNQ